MKRLRLSGRRSEHPKITLTVRRVEASVFKTLEFAKYHYLTEDINKSCKCLLFEWDGVPVAFVGILNTPRKGIPYGCSVSRIVVLPDYQGLGISTRIFRFVGGIVKAQSDDDHDYRLYIKTAHTMFGEALSRMDDVIGTAFDGKSREVGADKHKYAHRLMRKSYCKEYVGPPIYGYGELLRPIGEMRKEKGGKQLVLDF